MKTFLVLSVYKDDGSLLFVGCFTDWNDMEVACHDDWVYAIGGIINGVAFNQSHYKVIG